MCRRAAVILAAIGLLNGQPALKFEVASIKPNRYDMNAKAERPSSVEELHSMLQDLLADRFKLRFHRESKELPMYALTVDKDGPKLKRHEAQSAGDPWID